MRRISSFKPQYRQAPARSSTPPPPPYEPLSPVLLPAQLSTQPPAAAVPTATTHGARHANGADMAPSAPWETTHAHLPLSSPAVKYSAPLHSAPLRQPAAHYTLPLASPIEARHDGTMAWQQSSPAYVDPPRQTPQMATSPGFIAHSSSGRPSGQTYARDTAYLYSERPAKRARSEFYGSPPYGQVQSRPATSHIPGVSYNVERMVDNGMRMYPDVRASAPRQTEGPNDLMSDAQLLLDFFNVSAHTANTPPSTARRASLSYPAPSESSTQAAPQMQPMPEPINPFIAAPIPLEHYTHPPQTRHEAKLPPAPPFHSTEIANTASPAQTHTPPEEKIIREPQAGIQDGGAVEEAKPKKQQGWPKGKPRGPRNAPSTSKRKKSTPKPKAASSASTSGAPDQLQSPQSLPAEQPAGSAVQAPALPPSRAELSNESASQARRHSFSTPGLLFTNNESLYPSMRAQSLPLTSQEDLLPSAYALPPRPRKVPIEQPDLVCAACNSSDSETKVGDGEQWIGCDGCKEWYHYACVGFSSEREVRDVNKFYCEPCRPKFGETTKVRKSVRAHTTVDYAGLNEGVLKTSDDNPEHHYIAAFKNGDIAFTPETFARMPPELISGDFLEKTNGFREPIMIPGSLNPRPYGTTNVSPDLDPTATDEDQADLHSLYEYETTPNDGQDALDMVIPEGLTVRRVAELYGPNEPVPVIDVKAQEGEGKKWTMGKWADYYEQQGEKPVRNVISLEVSRSRMGRLIRRPKAVRDMDLQDSVWREDDKTAPPPVQFYCLMSVADCFTDFHIDFGGSSVYYHIVKGKKVFFFIPPTKQNLKKYEDWCLSPNQGHDWLGKQVKECYRVDLSPGDTMLIPSGWIHAVWTPEDSLVIGGNFLTRIHYGMQIKVLEIEKNTKVALQFRYPFFQKIMWLTTIKYLEEDPIPEEVQLLLQSGDQFNRSIPIYCEPDRFGHNSHPGASNYNRRYYSKHELKGLSDLLSYIWRTVLITLDKIDVPQRTRNAVNKSIPKGHGEPLVLARRFAMWIAWKRGNENIPSWAFPDAGLPEASESGDRKLSAAQTKKMERESANEALRATAERSSARIRAVTDSLPDSNGLLDSLENDLPPDTLRFGSLTGFLRPSANNPHITTPKTSQLGPKRVACDACRKRRIRCKHKDELVDTSKPGMHTIDLSGSYGISVKRRLSDHSIADGPSNSVSGPVNGGPIMADVNGDPYALKSGRVKACADCRKSKRRCIHDEYGNVDPIKANEIPIPRGSASKKRRVSDEDSASSAKRIRLESPYEDDYINGDMQGRQSLPNQFGVGSSFLQDLAYSAQQALDQGPEDDLVPVDPALQRYAHDDYHGMDLVPSYHQNGDSIMSSIEYQNGGTIPMDGIERTEHNGNPRGPSMEPLTPGPTADLQMSHEQSNGLGSKSIIEQGSSKYAAVRHPSSPISPRHVSIASPSVTAYNPYTTSPAPNTYNNFTADSDFPPPPATPTVNPSRPLTVPTSGGKASQTPRARAHSSKTPKSTPGGRRRDSKDGIKLEPGLSIEGVDMQNLDQASIDLIKQLQQEDRGLRRRSR